ncbi:elongation factor P 5-aminopentanone reductase [Priestia koreensis]|uniref:elongation factor P 5-aminopentanone reductase n=1 Tax=Priestia koreensis TaxID=284581 RepID=UPI001F58F8B9|nr:SDR family oxidoreductase [Priestia koreensis]UNL83804.1 SDR family oxidoreductase [Priestia koreensis]
MERYVLITGASGGIGQAVARAMAAEGYSLVLHYHQNEEAINQLKTELNTPILSVKANLASDEGVEELMGQLSVPIHTIVYISGNSYMGLVTDMTDAETKEMMNLHVTSPFKLSQRLLPNMIKNQSGNIVMMSSIWGLTGASCEVLYSTVKGAQISFVKALAKEVAPSRIRVNAIAPGAIQTNMMSHFTEEDLQMIAEEIPLGRIGKPEEVADTVVFITSPKASYITGQVISVNGGWHT